MEDFLGMLSEFYARATMYVGLPDRLSRVDVIEVLIISFLFYHILLWIKSTRAWNLFKGIMVIFVFVLVAAIFQMNTILWLAENTLSVGLIALVIIFQPELRRALENLGGKNVMGRFFSIGKTEDNKFSDRTIDELVKACFAMGKVKTGALIVVEDEILLGEYVRTGIDIDALVTSQLLINIFEKTTPFTGKVSLALRGQIYHDIGTDFMREKLEYLQNRNHEMTKLELLKRRFQNGKKNSKNSDE